MAVTNEGYVLNYTLIDVHAVVVLHLKQKVESGQIYETLFRYNLGIKYYIYDKLVYKIICIDFGALFDNILYLYPLGGYIKM